MWAGLVRCRCAGDLDEAVHLGYVDGKLRERGYREGPPPSARGQVDLCVVFSSWGRLKQVRTLIGQRQCVNSRLGCMGLGVRLHCTALAQNVEHC